ncbi:MAG: nucleotidyltransferase [Clostridium sp.]
MKITALITEYNPFHLGHKYHLEESKLHTKSDITIAIMSGNFMQRGTPAIVDKWERAKMAVLNGVDLVIELPTIYATSSAEFFAFGAISILNKLDIVDNIYFGSECGEVDKLESIARVLVNEPEKYKKTLKDYLSKGISYHKSRELSLMEYFNDNDISNIISSSNNILGIEYIKALISTDSKIKPRTLKRVGNNYNDKSLSNSFSSATSIRETLKSNKDLDIIKNTIPSSSINIFQDLKHNNYNFVFDEDIFSYLKYKLLTQGEKLKNLKEVSEGIDNRLIQEIASSSTLNEFILKCKSKRYTYTKINRILCSFFIGFENFNIEQLIYNPPSYIRPLAFNSNGAKLLKEIKKKKDVEIISNVPKHHDHPHLKLDILSTKAYSILNKSISPYEDHLRAPFILK